MFFTLRFGDTTKPFCLNVGSACLLNAIRDNLPSVEKLLVEREMHVKALARETEGKLETVKLALATSGDEPTEKQAAQLERWKSALDIRQLQLDEIRASSEKLREEGALDLAGEDGVPLDLRLAGKQSASLKLAERGVYSLIKMAAPAEGSETPVLVPLTWELTQDPARRTRGDSLSNLG